MGLRIAAVLACALSGCATSGVAIANAVSTSVVAAAASGVSRATGGCFASCPDGTTCNRANGLCEEVPCRSGCKADQRCEVTATGSRCAPVMIELNTAEPPAKP